MPGPGHGLPCDLHGGGDPKMLLQEAWRSMQGWYAANPTSSRFGRLTLSMFTSERSPYSDFPRLKGRAGETKALVPALLHAWEELMGTGTVQLQQVRAALQCSALMDRVLGEYPPSVPTLPPEAAQRFATAIWTFLACQNALCRHFVEGQGRKLFSITIKSHMLAHLALRAQVGNPRSSWCYTGEDWMHHLRRLASSSSRGTSERQLSSKIMDKYRWGVHFQLESRASFWR